MSFGGPSSRDDWWDVHRAEAAVIEAAKACRRFLVAAKGSRASTPTKTLAAAIDALLAAEARATHPMLFAAPAPQRLSSDAPDSQQATAATSGAPSPTTVGLRSAFVEAAKASRPAGLARWHGHDEGMIPRDATPEEVDAGCELGIAYDACPNCLIAAAVDLLDDDEGFTDWNACEDHE